ncbi:MAG: SSI family serine proteinase inhibitor [Kineosporiaceae bacterium]
MTGGRRARTAAVLGATLVSLAWVSGCGRGGETATSTGTAASTGAPAGATATGAVTTPDGEPGVVGGSPGSGATPTGGVTQVVTGTQGATGRGAPVPWEGSPMPTASLPERASGKAALTILLDDGFGVRTTWTLTCDPAGGTHPHPAAACGVLGARGAAALPAPKGTVCTEQYGGPQKAKITGTWKGTKVAAQLSLENGCEIGRWTALLGLLPPGGLPG